MVDKKVKKFAALLWILISAIILPAHIFTPLFASSFSKAWQYQSLQTRDPITRMKMGNNCSKRAQKKIKNTICYNNSLIHILYIKRLAKSFYFLSRLSKQNYHYEPCNVIKEKYCIYVDSIVFFHYKTRYCLQEMLQTKSLNPLLQLLQEVKHYYLFRDTLFIHELFLLVFIVHKQIVFNECGDNYHVVKQITLDTILEISERINQLPIAEVLNAIDMLVRELPPFLEKYEFNSSISWKAWLKKYWWVPPIFTGWFGLKILLSLQRPQFYYSTYLSPKPQVPIQPIMTNDPALIEIRHT